MSTALNLVDSVPVDYMHAVLEGVMRTLLSIGFFPNIILELLILGLS